MDRFRVDRGGRGRVGLRCTQGRSRIDFGFGDRIRVEVLLRPCFLSRGGPAAAVPKAYLLDIRAVNRVGAGDACEFQITTAPCEPDPPSKPWVRWGALLGACSGDAQQVVSPRTVQAPRGSALGSLHMLRCSIRAPGCKFGLQADIWPNRANSGRNRADLAESGSFLMPPMKFDRLWGNRAPIWDKLDPPLGYFGGALYRLVGLCDILTKES